MTKKKKNDIGCPSIANFRLDELVAAEYNPRTISDEAMEGLGNSIRKFGCVEPIVVNVRGGKKVIVGGHQRFRALQAMGEVVDLMCVTVDCSKADEKLLNLTLNNTQIQGRFVKEISEYIEQLRTDALLNNEMVDLKIISLQKDLINTISDSDDSTETLNYSEQTLSPYKRTHVLLSFDPVLFGKIQPHLDAISKIKGVEYEQGSN